MPVIGLSARGALEGAVEWLAAVGELRTVILASARRADREARVRAALHDLLTAAVPQAALRMRAPALKEEVRASYEARRAREVELGVIVAGPRIPAVGRTVADAILAAVRAAEEPASLRARVASAVLAAATCAVRSGHAPGGAAHAALEFALRGWSPAETQALDGAIPAAASDLRAAVHDAIRTELGSEAAANLVPEFHVAVAPPRPQLPPPRQYRSMLPGPLGKWRILNRFRDDVDRLVDAALDTRRAALEATGRSAVDEAIGSVLDEMVSVREDDGQAPPPGDPAAALRSLLVELAG